MRHPALVPVALCAFSCAKPGTEVISNAQTEGSASDAGARAVVNPSPSIPASWQGSYTSTAGPLYVPPAWNVRWSGGDASVGLGEGTLTMTIDAASRRVGGMVDGPLGPATLDGVVRDEKVAATIVHKIPGDFGFTGTLAGAIHDGRVEGTIRASSGEASTIRTAVFVLGPATR